MSYAKLASLASQGYTIKTTQLSEEFSYQDFLDKHDNAALVLFTIDNKDHIKPVKAMSALKPDSVSKLISLVPPKAPQEH